MLRFTKKTESGRSMIELIGVLAIMAIISAAAFVLIRSAMATQRRNQVVNDFMNIASGVRTLFADYDNLETVADLNSDDIFGAIGVDPDNTPYKNCKYSVTLDNSDNTYQTFTVWIFGTNTGASNLPARDCLALKSMNWPGAVSGAADSASVCSGADSTEAHYVGVKYKK